MKLKPDCDSSRRQFISDCAAIAPMVAIAATPVGAVAASPPSATNGELTDQGYRLTQHIAAYYKSATA
jgi:hypothetical protein